MWMWACRQRSEIDLTEREQALLLIVKPCLVYFQIQIYIWKPVLIIYPITWKNVALNACNFTNFVIPIASDGRAIGLGTKPIGVVDWELRYIWDLEEAKIKWGFICLFKSNMIAPTKHARPWFTYIWMCSFVLIETFRSVCLRGPDYQAMVNDSRWTN